MTSQEPDVHEELAALSADLKTWLQSHAGWHARTATAPAPQTTLPPEVAAGPEPPPDRRPARPAPVAKPPPAPAAARSAPPAAPVATPPPAAEPATPAARLTLLDEHLQGCTRCKLHRGRNNLVFGVGNPEADIVFVGEGPGYNEDRKGEPFVGKAGELLDRIITNVLRLSRDDVYICNVVKCRPPNNRDPEPDEVATCSPFLWRQLDAIQPAVVVGLGRFAIQTLLETSNSVGRLRGRAHPFRNAVLVPTYHPAYLLRNPEDKRKVFEDMKLVRKEFAERTGRELPPIVAGNKARSR